MLKFSSPLFFLVLVIVYFQGCGHGNNPAVPGGGGIQDARTFSGCPAQELNHQQLAYAVIIVDTETLDAEVIPLRTAETHFNVVKALNQNQNLVYVDVLPDKSDPSQGLFAMDIYIGHPFPDSNKYTGFDVKGVLITPGSLTVDNLKFADADETRLLNADGYTRWWNPSEFPQSGYLGYTKGLLVKTYAGKLTSTVNPYKYYADILFPESDVHTVTNQPLDSMWGRGVFTGMTGPRTFKIRFPMNPAPKIEFGYSVDVSWAPPFIEEPEQGPNDFPIEANQPEPYHVDLLVTDNTLYYDPSNGEHGGQLHAVVDVYDWQGQVNGNVAGEISSVRMISPGIFDTWVDGTFLGEVPHGVRFEFDLSSVAVPSFAGDALLICEVGSSDGSTYKQGSAPAPTDPLCAYQVETIQINDKECSADENNDFGDSEAILLSETMIGEVCLPDDPADYYNFYLLPMIVQSGGITLWCDYEPASVSLYNRSLQLIQTQNLSGGFAKIDMAGMGLPEGRYYLKVETTNASDVIPYSVQMDVVLTYETPHPTEVTPSSLSVGPIGSLSAYGDILYVGPYMYGADTVYSIDISDPSNASVLDSIVIDGPGWDISAGDGVVADITNDGKCRLIDSANPSDLKLIGEFGTPEGWSSAVIVGDMLYRSGAMGTQAWDISNPYSPVNTELLLFYSLYFLKASDAYVVGVNQNYGADIVSIKDPAHPVKVGEYQPEAMQRIDVYGDYLFVRWWTHFQIVDITTPSDPVLVGSFGPSYDSFQDRIDVDGRFAYFGGTSSLPIFEFPAIASIWPQDDPVYVYKFESEWPTGESVEDVLVHDGYVYFASYDGLRIFSL